MKIQKSEEISTNFQLKTQYAAIKQLLIPDQEKDDVYRSGLKIDLVSLQSDST